MLDKWNSSGKACTKWSFVMKAYDVAVDQQLSGAELCAGGQRAAWRCAVVCRLDHVVQRKSSGLCCNVQLVHGGMENALSCVFPVERCTDAQSGCWMHRNDKHRFECIGRGCLYERIQRCFVGFWRQTGFRVRVLVLREATASIRMSQDEAGPRHVTVEGCRQQRKEQERAQVLSQVQPSERTRSKQQRLGRDEMRRHGERRSEYAGDWSSVVAREKSRDSGWNRFVCCSDCLRSFSLVRNEKVTSGSEHSKCERQAPAGMRFREW